MQKTISITGHTSGIGQAIYDHFSETNTVKGFSRTNGYDICHNREQIINESNASDIFINNAHCYWCQVDLLYELFDKWRYHDKIIINISSLVEQSSEPYKRTIQKQALNNACEQLQKCESNCLVINVMIGLVDTLLVSSVEEPKMNTNDLINIIEWIVNQPEHIYINNISFRRK